MHLDAAWTLALLPLLLPVSFQLLLPSPVSHEKLATVPIECSKP